MSLYRNPNYRRHFRPHPTDIAREQAARKQAADQQFAAARARIAEDIARAHQQASRAHVAQESLPASPVPEIINAQSSITNSSVPSVSSVVNPSPNFQPLTSNL